MQVIAGELRIPLRIDNLSNLPEEEKYLRVQEAFARNPAPAFDLANGPLLRVKLLKLGEQEHIFVRTTHHIVSDGWSQGVFNREFMALYEAYRAGWRESSAVIGGAVADFALWQRQWFGGGALWDGLEHWKKELAGMPEKLELPMDRRAGQADICRGSVPLPVGQNPSGGTEPAQPGESRDLIYDVAVGAGHRVLTAFRPGRLRDRRARGQ